MRVARFAGWGAVLVVLLLAAYGVWGHIRRSNAAVETLMQADNLVPIVRTSEV